MPGLDLVWLSASPAPDPSWPMGSVIVIPPEPHAVAEALVAPSDRDGVLLWHERLGPPDPDRVAATSSRPWDVQHAGLTLGTPKPQAMAFVGPTWMLNADPAASVGATSWRLTFDACLIKQETIGRLGGPHACFSTLAGAAAELGYRYIRSGAVVRHIPELVEEGSRAGRDTPAMSAEDERRFVMVGRQVPHAMWARARMGRIRSSVPAGGCGCELPQTTETDLQRPTSGLRSRESWRDRVSVVIPTLDRYRYLEVVLAQLSSQSITPREVLVVDQTEEQQREEGWAQSCGDVPLRTFVLPRAGQSTARNQALRHAQGDHILFLDDDVEIPPDLIERHAAAIEAFDADASCGVADEVGAGPLPAYFTYPRVSDVFPTNNTLLRREALVDSGLFDEAFDRGARADHDIGMRLYLSGKLLMLTPEARVLHHRAPRGGLRSHGARVITYASARRSSYRRQLVTPTEAYLWMRYFGSTEVKEAIRIRMLSSLRREGTMAQRALRSVIGVLLLPSTWIKTRAVLRQASEMLSEFPRISRLSDDAPEAIAPASASPSSDG